MATLVPLEMVTLNYFITSFRNHFPVKSFFIPHTTRTALSLQAAIIAFSFLLLLRQKNNKDPPDFCQLTHSIYPSGGSQSGRGIA